MFDALSPADRELDLLTLSIQVFGPLFAAGLILLTPKRYPELTRWVAVSFAAALLTLGLCRFIDYYTILDSYSDRTVTSLYHPAATLDARSDQQAADAAQPVPRPYRSDDLLVRRPWAARLDLDYALGVDGLGLAVTLLAALATLVASIASFSHDMRMRPTLALGFVLQTAVTGAALALDLALMTAFLGLAVVALALLLAPANALGRRFLVTASAGGIALLIAVLLLHRADVRDFVDPGVHAAHAADARQVDPLLTPDEALARTPVHSFDPVTLAKFQRAASRDGLVASQTAAGRPARATLFIFLVVSATCGLGLFPAQNWLADALTRLPAPAAITLTGAVWPLAGLLAIRLLLMLGSGVADLWQPLLGGLGLASLIAGVIAGLRTTDLARLAAAQLTTAGGLAFIGLGAWGDAPEAWEQGVAGAALVIIGAAIAAMLLVWLAAVMRARLDHADLTLAGPLGTRAPGLATLTAITLLLGAAIPGSTLFIGALAVLSASLHASVLLGVLAVMLTLIQAARRLALVGLLATGRAADTRNVTDLSVGEWLPMTGLIALTVAFGVAPSLVFIWLDPSIQGLVSAAVPMK